MLRCTAVAIDKLTPAMRRSWSEFQRSNDDLQSPFFHHQFATAVAACRAGVKVCILEDRAGVAGFFPFQQVTSTRCQPLGAPVSDYHGVISRPGLHFDLHSLRAAGLTRFDYDHLVLRQAAAFGGDCNVAFSPFLDLSAGFASFERRINQRSQRLKGLRRKQRKLAREHGELKFEFNTASRETLEAVIASKSSQYQRTGVRDIFRRDPWTVKLLHHLASCRSEEFRGVLSALHVGGKLVAAHFGMICGNTMHWWFPVYDPQYAAYSPGALLLLEVAEAAAARGIATLDLGKGDEDYKSTLCSGQILLAEGSTAPHSPQVLAGRCYKASRRWLKASPVGAALVAARSAGYALLGRFSTR